MILERFIVTLTANGKCSDSSCEFLIKIEKKADKNSLEQLRYKNGMKLLAFV